MKFNVRQWSMLSPYLFAVCLNEIIDQRAHDLRTLVVINYADDILLLA